MFAVAPLSDIFQLFQIIDFIVIIYHRFWKFATIQQNLGANKQIMAGN